MSDDLRDLYQEVILEYGRHPRNLGKLGHTTHRAEGHNPLCGDQIAVSLDLGPDGAIRDIAFEGRGCAISVASASLMTESVKGKTVDVAKSLFDSVREMCMGEGDAKAPAGLEDELERLQVLGGVRQFPMRVKCATLAWHTLKAAMDGKAEASTE